MLKKYSPKFWLAFWTISIIFLAGWFFYWNAQSNKMTSVLSGVVGGVMDFLPIDQSNKKEYQALIKFGEYFLENGSDEKTFLVLFQNNMELRPGGGFIGAFAIVKLKDGKIISMTTHDLSNFDERIPDGIAPPYPMQELSLIHI